MIEQELYVLMEVAISLVRALCIIIWPSLAEGYFLFQVSQYTVQYPASSWTTTLVSTHTDLCSFVHAQASKTICVLREIRTTSLRTCAMLRAFSLVARNEVARHTATTNLQVGLCGGYTWRQRHRLCAEIALYLFYLKPTAPNQPLLSTRYTRQ